MTAVTLRCPGGAHRLVAALSQSEIRLRGDVVNIHAQVKSVRILIFR
jgi:hypothetical protein